MRTPNSTGHYAQIELKSTLADPANPQSIRDLAHEIVAYPHVYPVPPELCGLVEEKLTDAEIRFRTGIGPGVDEAELVTLINWMIDRFRLPAYAKATPQQVRTLRMKLVILSPNLMGNTLSGHDVKLGGHIHSVMSPLQAAHLLSTMFDAKILNPDYQDPSIDILASEREQRKASQHSSYAGRNMAVASRANPKRQEMREAISASAASMTMQDAYDIINHAFKALHLN